MSSVFSTTMTNRTLFLFIPFLLLLFFPYFNSSLFAIVKSETFKIFPQQLMNSCSLVKGFAFFFML